MTPGQSKRTWRFIWIGIAALCCCGPMIAGISGVPETKAPEPLKLIIPTVVVDPPSPDIPEEQGEEGDGNNDRIITDPVTAGAYCPRQGAVGHTKSGTRMVCILKPGEKQPRWRRP